MSVSVYMCGSVCITESVYPWVLVCLFVPFVCVLVCLSFWDGVSLCMSLNKWVSVFCSCVSVLKGSVRVTVSEF